MATLNEIQALWETDCIIDGNHLDNESILIPKLHSKYLSILMDTKLRLSKYNNELSILKKNKFRYYRGELSRQELAEFGWSQWLYAKPLKNEMDQLLAGDTQVSEMKLRLEYLETTEYTLESILKTIANRSYHIGDAIKYKLFLAGN